MVIVQQVHHISVSSLTLDYTITVFKTKDEAHFCEGSNEDRGKECHSERLLLKKRRAWRSCSPWKVPQEAAVALRGGWDRRKEQQTAAVGFVPTPCFEFVLLRRVPVSEICTGLDHIFRDLFETVF